MTKPLVASLAAQPSASGAPSLPRVRARVAVLGASGYSGQEFTRLALAHPGLEVAQLVSREYAGRPARELLIGSGSREAPPVVTPGDCAAAVREGAIDTIVACLPHGAWRELSAEFHDASPLAQGVRIVDLSADFRDGGSGYRYGQPESRRDGLAGARRIANPGCYPTAATLALWPALDRDFLSGPIMVSAVSGVTGAGRSANVRNAFVERDGGAELYKAGTVHSHVSEMTRHWASARGALMPVGFAPTVVPMARGILAVVNATLAEPLTPEQAHEQWSSSYANEPFVRVLPPGSWPDTRAVRGSNRCDVAVTTLHDGRTLLAASAIDNLVKGAAGQAIQNLNLMLGWPEPTALPVDGLPW